MMKEWFARNTKLIAAILPVAVPAIIFGAILVFPDPIYGRLSPGG